MSQSPWRSLILFTLLKNPSSEEFQKVHNFESLQSRAKTDDTSFTSKFEITSDI